MKLQLFYLLFVSSLSFYSCAQGTNDPNIVFKDEKGNIISKSDLKNTTGQVNWELMGEKTIPQKAMKLHEEARRLGSQGQYQESIQKLLKAHKIAPNWAYPVYDLAYTYLLQKDFENALQYYALTNEIEPKGFFTAKTAYWSLQKEKEGLFPQGLYLAFMSLEWTDSDAEKIQMAQGIVEQFPAYAPAWQLLGSKLDNAEERLAAIEKGLAIEADQETTGILLINKAIVEDMLGHSDVAKEILGKVVFDENATISNVELAKYVLASLVE